MIYCGVWLTGTTRDRLSWSDGLKRHSIRRLSFTKLKPGPDFTHIHMIMDLTRSSTRYPSRLDQDWMQRRRSETFLSIQVKQQDICAFDNCTHKRRTSIAETEVLICYLMLKTLRISLKNSLRRYVELCFKLVIAYLGHNCHSTVRPDICANLRYDSQLCLPLVFGGYLYYCQLKSNFFPKYFRSIRRLKLPLSWISFTV